MTNQFCKRYINFCCYISALVTYKLVNSLRDKQKKKLEKKAEKQQKKKK